MAKDIRIQLVDDNNNPLLECPHCKAKLTEKGALSVTTSDGDKHDPQTDTIDVTLQPDGFMPDKDDDEYEFDHGTECETKCSKCDGGLNEFFKTNHGSKKEKKLKRREKLIEVAVTVNEGERDGGHTRERELGILGGTAHMIVLLTLCKDESYSDLYGDLRLVIDKKAGEKTYPLLRENGYTGTEE